MFSLSRVRLNELFENYGRFGIYTDNEIKDEAFLEYMDNVLASNEVSNLFIRDEIFNELTVAVAQEFLKQPAINEYSYDYFFNHQKVFLVNAQAGKFIFR